MMVKTLYFRLFIIVMRIFEELVKKKKEKNQINK